MPYSVRVTDPQAGPTAPPIPPAPRSLPIRMLAEALGSAGLITTVVGSGIMATRLTDDAGLQLLINALATAAALVVLILVLGPVSGAQLNPAVTSALAAVGRVPAREILPTVAAQLVGFVAGAMLGNLMYGEEAVSISTTERAGLPLLLGEVVATAGLVAVILTLVLRDNLGWVPAAVGLYIGSAYFVTSSTSFANPGITLGRVLSDSFAGIAPASMPAFLVAQFVGATLGVIVVRLVIAPSRVVV